MSTSGPYIEFGRQAGRLLVRDARLFHSEGRGFARRFIEALCEHSEVGKVEVDLGSSTCRVDFDLDSNDPAIMARIFADAVAEASSKKQEAAWKGRKSRWAIFTARRSSGEVLFRETQERRQGRRLPELGSSDQALPALKASTSVAGGWKRGMFLALSGGAFTLTLVGLVVPGIPTVPFLLATSYCLARSSPRLDDKFRRTVFLGPILREWEDHAALSATSKGTLIGLTVVVVVMTFALIPWNPMAMVLIILMATISLGGIVRMPSLDDQQDGTPSSIESASRLALPAH